MQSFRGTRLYARSSCSPRDSAQTTCSSDAGALSVHLRSAADPAAEAPERDGPLVINHILQVPLSLRQLHVLQRACRLSRVLEVRPQVAALGLQTGMDPCCQRRLVSPPVLGWLMRPLCSRDGRLPLSRTVPATEHGHRTPFVREGCWFCWAG